MPSTNAEMESLGKAFSAEENEQLTRVGPGELMGDLFRQYWIPVVPLEFIEEPGGKPRRVRLLGEDLVLFRTRKGELGLIGAYCSHRLAPLFFGHIEDDGIRCPYHGWKYAPSGECVETPNVPADENICDMIHHPGYPCVEYGGAVWTYMGPSKELPPMPEFEFAMVPDELRNFRVFHQECNYLQVLEGGIDPTHVMWLHSPYDLSDDEIAAQHQPEKHLLANRSGLRTPEAIEFSDTAGGFMYGARRSMGDGNSLWRVNQFIMPFYTMPPGGDRRSGRIYVPIDDENSVKWMFTWYPTREVMEASTEKQPQKNRGYFDDEVHLSNSIEPFGFLIPKARKSNDYLINWEVHKSRRLGITGVNLQDRCVQENEGPTPILDRTQENLCSGDLSTVKARRMMLKAAKALRDQGTVPAGVGTPSIYRVRGVSKMLPDTVDWVEGVKEDVTVATRAA